MPTLEFKIPNGKTDSSQDAVTISYNNIATDLDNAKLPRYIQWTSGTMTCTIKKNAGVGKLPISMKIGNLTIYTDSNGIPIVGDPTPHSITITPDTANISTVIVLSGSGNYSIGIPSWVFGQDDTTVYKTYTYSNTGLTINYDNPKYTIEGLSNNPEWGEITGTGDFEIIEKGKILTPTITAVPKPNCRFLCWDDGVMTSSREVVLKESALSAHKVTKTYSALFAPIALYAGVTPISEIYVGNKKPKSTAAQPESYKRGDKMPTGYIPILQIKQKMENGFP